MANLVLVNPYIEINGVDRSTWIKKVSIPLEADTQENTAFGGGGWKTRLPGLKDGSLQLTFNQDFAASNVDATMWALFGTITTFKVRPDAGAIGTGNPEYRGSVVVDEWTPLDTEVGGLVEVTVDFPAALAFTRHTA